MASNLRGIHLDPVDYIPLSGAVFNKPMLYSAAVNTIIQPGASGFAGDEDDKDDSFLEEADEELYFALQEAASATQLLWQAEGEAADRFLIAPNPLRSAATIEYKLASPAQVSLSILDLNGRMIRNLVNASQEAGVHQVIFERGNLPPGIYLCRLVNDGAIQTKRMVITQ